jgi:hypothetical protein
MPTRPVPVTAAVRRLSEAMPKDICQGATDLIAQVVVELAAQSQAQDSTTGLRVQGAPVTTADPPPSPASPLASIPPPMASKARPHTPVHTPCTPKNILPDTPQDRIQ